MPRVEVQFLEAQSLCGPATWQNLVTYESSLTETGCVVTVKVLVSALQTEDVGVNGYSFFI